MNDLKDLADYVVNHPDAYEYRWRLAKKLYMAWEYNESLKHLQILKKKWNRKLNILRYLAATYYRLGRYDEAVTELEQILAQWPSEIPVWEQLAKVHEVAGHAEQAATAWEGVLRLDPDHSIASRSVQRLRSTPANTPQDELHLADSDSGINLRSGRICENCGAQNSEEFDRCWQCHASLAHPHTPLSVKPLPERTTFWRNVGAAIGGGAPFRHGILRGGVHRTTLSSGGIDQRNAPGFRIRCIGGSPLLAASGDWRGLAPLLPRGLVGALPCFPHRRDVAH